MNELYDWHKKLQQLKNAYKGCAPAPDFWTVKQFLDFRIREFGLNAYILLPDGERASDDMTLGELRKLYQGVQNGDN